MASKSRTSRTAFAWWRSRPFSRPSIHKSRFSRTGTTWRTSQLWKRYLVKQTAITIHNSSSFAPTEPWDRGGNRRNDMQFPYRTLVLPVPYVYLRNPQAIIMVWMHSGWIFWPDWTNIFSPN
jgi:hypothetical protein